jgi:uncharacterized protein (TIGR02391 family)
LTLYPGWTVSPDEVMALPLDELGLRILADISFQRDLSGTQPLNERTWIMHLAQSGDYHGRQDAVAACCEAWTWLRAKTLIATDASRGQFGDGWVIVTRRGTEILARGLDYLRAVERLDVDLHPMLEAKARPQFLRGDFETAVFVAFKEVEVRVRELGGFDASDLGVPLMRNAFRQAKDTQAPGPLTDPMSDGGEQVATMELFAGAIGAFKNPSSHRQVNYEDPTEAAEVLLTADLLMRILDRVERRLRS